MDFLLGLPHSKKRHYQFLGLLVVSELKEEVHWFFWQAQCSLPRTFLKPKGSPEILHHHLKDQEGRWDLTGVQHEVQQRHFNAAPPRWHGGGPCVLWRSHQQEGPLVLHKENFDLHEHGQWLNQEIQRGKWGTRVTKRGQTKTSRSVKNPPSRKATDWAWKL